MRLTKDQYYLLKSELDLDKYIYKKLFRSWYLFRMYQDSKSHPIGYHIIVVKRLSIEKRI